MGAISLDWVAMVAVANRPAPRPYVDFASVPPSQWQMHDRLENWARWCRGTGRQSGRGSPMFALFRSTARARTPYGEHTAVPIDRLDAARVQVGVSALPDKHRRAIHWHYLHPGNPSAAARELAVTLEGLRGLVVDGRQMLVNRGA
jgi:hypothetical protein